MQDFKEAVLAEAHLSDFASSYLFAFFGEVVSHESVLSLLGDIDVPLDDEAARRVRVRGRHDHLIATVADIYFNGLHFFSFTSTGTTLHPIFLASFHVLLKVWSQLYLNLKHGMLNSKQVDRLE
jgi:hypothetical protein